jgi:uncharacterized protein (TIGR03437 family)
MTKLVVACCVFVAAPFSTAQTISRVLNAASLDTRLAPGCLATIAGTNLGTATSTAVTVGGKAAAVVAASPTQFTIQIPFDAPTGANTLQVGSSAPFNITLSQYAPALFTSDSTGSGIVLGTHADGGAITHNYPAALGETVSIFATGLGPTVPPLATGAAGPENPPAATAVQPSVIYASETGTVVSSVMAPGQVGVYKITFKLNTVPVTGTRGISLSIGGASSGFNVSIPVAAGWFKPVISGVLSATGIPGSVQEFIQAGSWVAIYGTNLALASRDWSGLITGGRLPTVMMGVRVSIDGKPAAIYFASPAQINVQAPDGIVGPVPVVVTNNDQVSEPVIAQARTHAPAFFQWGASMYAVATRYPDNAYIGGPLAGPQFVGAKPGDIVILWGTGFGPTEPPTPAGITVVNAALTATMPTVAVGGPNVEVLGAALSPGLAGVYQIAIRFPSGIPAGDTPVKATIAGFATPDNVRLYVAPN